MRLKFEKQGIILSLKGNYYFKCVCKIYFMLVLNCFNVVLKITMCVHL